MRACKFTAVLVVCCTIAHSATIAALEISLPVEHAIGDAAFAPAGHLKGVIQPKALTSTLRLERTKLTVGQQEQLRSVAQEAGYYRVRVGRPGGQHLVTSIPAKCLAGAQERLTAAITPSGDLISINYDLSQMTCDPAPLHTAAKDWSLSEAAPVLVALPLAAPQIPRDIVAPPEVKRGSQSGAMKPRAGAAAAKGAEEGEAAPPPDNRTWLQKNWIYLLPVAFMLLNGMAGGGAARQQGGGGQVQGAAQRQRQAPR